MADEAPGPSGFDQPLLEASWHFRLTPDLWLVAGRDARPPGPQEIYLRRGRAFPVGHPTTRLCLQLLQDLVPMRQPRTLLEVGCGSGVLCLAAAALGVHRIIGLDLAWEAVVESQENARRNHLAGAISLLQGSTECLRETFELVIANLPAAVLLAKDQELLRLTAPAGNLIISGFREPEEPALLELYPAVRWRRDRRLQHAFHHPELPPQYNFTWVAWQFCRHPPDDI